MKIMHAIQAHFRLEPVHVVKSGLVLAPELCCT